MKRLFGRSLPASTEGNRVGVDRDAHGCPACPHPAAFADDSERSTLLPIGGLALDGRALQVTPNAELDGPELEGLDAIELD